jgi:class 3 adenylate cyclase
MRESKELRDLVLGFYHDWAAGDPVHMDLLSEHPDALAIGTDPREWWVGGRGIRAIWRRQLEELGGSVAIKPGRLKCYVEGSVGWVQDDPTVTLADGTEGTWRVTFVLHKEAAAWKIVQFHASIGVANVEHFGREVTTSIDAVADRVAKERPDLRSVASAEGTVTIMFTDIESSTALNEQVGDDRWIALHREHDRFLRGEVEAAGGTIVRSRGDGFMLAFPSARRAVECAISIQRGLAQIESAQAPVKVRMGIHTGEPVREADDFYGRDVAYAARVGAVAVGGEILVSSLVKSLVEPSGAFGFDGPRELDLKGFEGRQSLFAVRWR